MAILLVKNSTNKNKSQTLINIGGNYNLQRNDTYFIFTKNAAFSLKNTINMITEVFNDITITFKTNSYITNV